MIRFETNGEDLKAFDVSGSVEDIVKEALFFIGGVAHAMYSAANAANAKDIGILATTYFRTNLLASVEDDEFWGIAMSDAVNDHGDDNESEVNA